MTKSTMTIELEPQTEAEPIDHATRAALEEARRGTAQIQVTAQP